MTSIFYATPNIHMIPRSYCTNCVNNANGEVCRSASNPSLKFVPVAIETDNVLGQGAQTFFQELAHHLSGEDWRALDAPPPIKILYFFIVSSCVTRLCHVWYILVTTLLTRD